MAIKESGLLEKYVGNLLNDPAVGLIQIQKCVKVNVPQDFGVIQELNSSYEKLVNSIPDIENTIDEIRGIRTLDSSFVLSMEKKMFDMFVNLDILSSKKK